MNEIRHVQLSEIAELITKGTTPTTLGYQFQDEGINFLKIECFDENGNFIEDKATHISIECHEKLKRSQLKAGDILFSIAGAIGRVAIVTEDMLPANTNQALAIIRISDDDIYLPYIKLILTSPIIEKQFGKKKQGVAQLNLSLKDINELSIPLPDRDSQVEYADLFSKVRVIIDQRNLELKSLDDLVKARFVELFGDPVSNSKGLPIATLPELGEFGRGVSKHRPRNDPNLLGGDYPLIQTGDVAAAELYITDYSATYSELGLKQSKMWDKGTLCITIAANIAKTAILTFDACFPDSVVGFMANERTSNIFIHYWFCFFQAILESQAPESAQKNINLKILSELKVINPSKEAQVEFESFVKQVDKSKVVVQEALDKVQLLFDSLMQEYFG